MQRILMIAIVFFLSFSLLAVLAFLWLILVACLMALRLPRLIPWFGSLLVRLWRHMSKRMAASRGRGK